MSDGCLFPSLQQGDLREMAVLKELLVGGRKRGRSDGRHLNLAPEPTVASDPKHKEADERRNI